MPGQSFASTQGLATATADAINNATTQLAQIDWPPSIKPTRLPSNKQLVPREVPCGPSRQRRTE
jgi:hypothetical protein